MCFSLGMVLLPHLIGFGIMLIGVRNGFLYPMVTAWKLMGSSAERSFTVSPRKIYVSYQQSDE